METTETTENYLKSAVKNAKESIDREIELLAHKRLALSIINEKLGDFPYPLSISFGYGGYKRFSLDFDRPSREATVLLIKKLVAGKWDKELCGDTAINYTNDTAYDFTLRIFQATPPDTCRIVTEEVEVPEAVVPAYKTTRTRMVCIEG
jgi:hypothetical protein